MLLFVWLLSYTGSAAPAFNSHHQDVYHELLKLKVKSGRALLLPQQHSNNAADLLLANYGDFLELCVQQNQGRLHELLEAQETRLEMLEDLPQQDKWVLYAKAEVQMQLAMSKLLFGNRLSAAWDFRKAYLQYSHNVKKHPEFLPNRKNLGVLQVLIGSVPDKYKWFLSIIGLKGSIRQGMANLKQATAPENPFYQEAQLLYVVVKHLTEPEKEVQALKQIKSMAEKQPDNLLFQFVAMHLFKKARASKEALQVYLHVPRTKAYLSFPYLHHLAADLYLYRADYDKSVQENRKFLELHKGQHYLKSANYKLYLAYALGNHKPQAQWHLQHVSQVGIEETEEDRYAARYALKQEPLVKPLMQARLYSDGGYYQEALQELKKLHISTKTPVAIQAEYYYRKARIYHGTDSLQQALPLYKQAISLCEGTDLYFAPSASLQLGYVYQELKQINTARLYFKQALSYKQHEYKNSIDAKAKLALSAM
ncbi:DUF3808 domain-containing protein [Pontibacter korlensis]|uniref:DUF3808 domain-containing protein n=1 Tax=Pontibacter korlensis TaxID=400092 RepID=UPI0039EFC349